MKYIVIFLLVLNIAQADNIKPSNNQHHLNKSQKKNLLKKFLIELRKDIIKNLSYPSTYRKRSIEGSFNISFVVSKNGNVKITKFYGKMFSHNSSKKMVKKINCNKLSKCKPFYRPAYRASKVAIQKSVERLFPLYEKDIQKYLPKKIDTKIAFKIR